MTVLANDRTRPPLRMRLGADSPAPLSQKIRMHDMGAREGIHVGDCYVWAEIFYLDSPTNYREYIPRKASHKGIGRGSDFITLDAEATFLGTLLAIGRSIGRRLTRMEEL